MDFNNKQLLTWTEELAKHKERLMQATKVKDEEEKIIALIEGGIQYGQALQKKYESESQPLNTKEKSTNGRRSKKSLQTSSSKFDCLSSRNPLLKPKCRVTYRFCFQFAYDFCS